MSVACLYAADKIVSTLGEGTFGKVVQCLDFTNRFVYVCLAACLSVSVHVYVSVMDS